MRVGRASRSPTWRRTSASSPSAAPFRVAFERRAEKQLGALDSATQARIVTVLARLEVVGPFAAPNVKALVGGGYRLRVGDWRILFAVEGDLALVVRVAHRREAYR